MKILESADKAIGLALKTITFICLGSLFFILLCNVGARYLRFSSFPWTDEISELSIAWMLFIGSAALWRDHEHFKIDIVLEKLGNRISAGYYRVVLDIICTVFFILLTVYGLEYTIRSTQMTPILNFSKRYLFVCIPLSGIIMTAYSLRDLIVDIKKIIHKPGIKEIQQ